MLLITIRGEGCWAGGAPAGNSPALQLHERERGGSARAGDVYARPQAPRDTRPSAGTHGKPAAFRIFWS
jgi:hypothetical protein